MPFFDINPFVDTLFDRNEFFPVLNKICHGYHLPKKKNYTTYVFSPYKNIQDGCATFLDIILKPALLATIAILTVSLECINNLADLNLKMFFLNLILVCITPLLVMPFIATYFIIAVIRTKQSITHLASNDNELNNTKTETPKEQEEQEEQEGLIYTH